MKTLKAEEVWLQRYRTLDEARAIGEFIDEIYNQRRLHCVGISSAGGV